MQWWSGASARARRSGKCDRARKQATDWQATAATRIAAAAADQHEAFHRNAGNGHAHAHVHQRALASAVVVAVVAHRRKAAVMQRHRAGDQGDQGGHQQATESAAPQRVKVHVAQKVSGSGRVRAQARHRPLRFPACLRRPQQRGLAPGGAGA